MKHIVKVMTACCAAALLLNAPLAIAQAVEGSIVGWGANVVGADLSTPFVAIADGGNEYSGHHLGLRPDGTIMAWGRNEWGQCDVPAPNGDFVGVAAGGDNSYGLRADGTTAAWGESHPFRNPTRVSWRSTRPGLIVLD